MRRLAGIVVLAGGLFAFVAVAALFLDPRILADRSMRPPHEACPRLDLGPRQCAAAVAHALEAAGVDAADVVQVTMGRPDGPSVELGGRQVAVVRATTREGIEIVQEVRCTGVGTQELAWCTEDPLLPLWMGANHDTPGCVDGSTVCVTPIPLDPAAAAAARPLEIARLVLPMTVGPHDIELGRALLPNGYLDEARFALADPAPDGVVMRDGVRLVVEPADPTRPQFGNVYERGTIPGVEEAIVSLRFEVVEAPPGAVLEIVDLLVR